MRLLLPALLLALAGCASAGTVVKDRFRDVSVPVAVKPIAERDIPALPLPLPAPRPASDSAAADLALAGFCDAIRYVLEADPLLRLSAGVAPRILPRYSQCEDPTDGP